MKYILSKFIIGICMVLVYVISSNCQNKKLIVTGNIALSSKYSTGTSRPYSYSPAPWEYTSNSRLSLQYGQARLNLTVNKPLIYFRSGQPDKYYTIEFSLPYLAAKYGDLNPQFTQNTTGFSRVSGVEGKINFFNFLELNSIYGKSKIATPTQGYFIGNYSQDFLGGRIKLTPLNSFNLGVSAVKIKDDINSASLSVPYSKICAKDNLLLGSDLSIFFLNRRANLTVEYAVSFYNSDQTAAITDSIIEGDSKVTRWTTKQDIITKFITKNDSTRAGEVIAARLVLPISTSRFTFEYRRASKSFVSLAMPYDPMDHERFRMSNNLNLFSNLLNMMSNFEFSRNNISKIQEFTTNYLNFFANLNISPKFISRITIGYRHNQRYNDAPFPVPKKWDRRMKTFMRSVNFSVSNNLGIGIYPLTITGTLTGSWYDDRIRSTSNYSMYSAQLYTQTLPASRTFWNTQIGYSINRRYSTGVIRHSVQLYFREGYDIVYNKFQIYGIEGINVDRTSDEKQKTNSFNWGAGTKWTPKTNTIIELEWQHNGFRDYIYNDYNYGQNFFELRMSYGI